MSCAIESCTSNTGRKENAQKSKSFNQDDSKRPDGMSLIPWNMGQMLVWDAVCVDTLAPSHLHGTSYRAGAATEAREKGKTNNVNFVDKWPLMNPNELVFVLMAYLLFVLVVGPVVMEKRPPFQLRRLLIGYNIFKVCNCGILTAKFLSYLLEKGLFPRACEHDDVTTYTIAAFYWKFMATKVFDLPDTIFFVLRKKNNQLTFLHVYHHVFMVSISWIALKYDPSDHWAFMATLNCFVHTVMYTYYGIAVLGPVFARFLWWKKYLTILQLVQFVLVIAHITVQSLTSQCPIHAVTYCVGLANTSLFICLFADFYKKRYKSGNLKAEEFICSQHLNE